jgi:hypothetical protein
LSPTLSQGDTIKEARGEAEEQHMDIRTMELIKTGLRGRAKAEGEGSQLLRGRTITMTMEEAG